MIWPMLLLHVLGVVACVELLVVLPRARCSSVATKSLALGVYLFLLAELASGLWVAWEYWFRPDGEPGALYVTAEAMIVAALLYAVGMAFLTCPRTAKHHEKDTLNAPRRLRTFGVRDL